MNVLFVTWDGPQVSYLESLFLPIFHRLKIYGIHFYVLQFTWSDAKQIRAVKNKCQQVGINYQHVPILRIPKSAGAMLTAIIGSHLIKKAIKRFGIDIVMPRSTLPGLATLLVTRQIKVPFVFDADGLPLDERIDFAETEPTSVQYRILRDIEAQAVRQAQNVLVRSDQAVEILLARAGAGTDKNKFHVVTNGRDTKVFTPGTREQRTSLRNSLDVDPSAPLIVYAGSAGKQYCLKEMFGFFQAVSSLKPEARFLLLSGSPEALDEELSFNLNLKEQCIIRRVSPDRVPTYLRAADLGIALRRPSYSMQGVAPIKVGEYLLCGLPTLLVKGATFSLEKFSEDACWYLDGFDEQELNAAAAWFVNHVLKNREFCRDYTRDVALKFFSLDNTIQTYAHALETAAAKNI